MPELRGSIHPTGPGHLGDGGRGMIALVNPDRLRRILSRMLDENEFLSPYGIRALSRYHAEHPLRVQRGRPGIPGELSSGGIGHRHVRRQLQLARAGLDAGECAADSRPVVVLSYYGDNFKVECPTGSGKLMNLFEVAREIARPADQNLPARRSPAAGRSMAERRSFRRILIGGTMSLFYEYFHGDNGAGLGASHQTGWTGWWQS